MAKVSKYSIRFYSGEQGYQNNRAQITLADAAGNSLAFVRFKDPSMPYELEMPSATRRPTSTIRSGRRSCSPS
jgi:hypothetical protein